MAELTHLNEASVVHNLHMRYQADLIHVGGTLDLYLARLTRSADILWSFLGHDKSLLSLAHLHARICQHV